MRISLWKVVVWLSGASFYTIISAYAWSNLPPISITSSLHQTPALLHCNSGKSEWEDDVRTKASIILQSVFLNSTRVERAVNVGLRPIKNGKMRKRVSELALGTFIMRKRHEYIYNTTENGNKHVDSEDKIRYMVDLHADYLMMSDTIDDNDNMFWPSDPVERIALQYSMPVFLVRAWVGEYGVEDTLELCALSNHPGPITLRRNSIRCSSDDELIQRLASEEDITLSSPKFFLPGCLRVTSGRPKSIWAMSAWKDGWFEVQDVGSQFIVEALELDGNGDKLIVDYCAGNGGKTLAILSQLHSLNSSSETIVWAHDVEEQRLAQLRGSLPRVGFVNETNIQLFTTTNADADLNERLADVVLVDAPCSSCGVLRRRPSHRWELEQQELEHNLPKLQFEILRKASRLVKPGGRLIYATCSLCRCENEQVATEFEKSDSSSEWEPWPFPETWPIARKDQAAPSHFCKLLPHKHDSDGFFISRWNRKIDKVK